MRQMAQKAPGSKKDDSKKLSRLRMDKIHTKKQEALNRQTNQLFALLGLGNLQHSLSKIMSEKYNMTLPQHDKKNDLL